MNAKNIYKQIVKLGGTAKITTVERAQFGNYDKVEGRIGKYTIEFSENCSSYLTARKDGTQFDIGSDYNPGGYIFYHKIKDLAYLI